MVQSLLNFFKIVKGHCYGQGMFFSALGILLYVLIGCIVSGISLLFFTYFQVTDKSIPSYESREFNDECYLDDFYDTHDIWHLFASFALMMMVLINVQISKPCRTCYLEYKIRTRERRKSLHTQWKKICDARKSRMGHKVRTLNASPSLDDLNLVERKEGTLKMVVRDTMIQLKGSDLRTALKAGHIQGKQSDTLPQNLHEKRLSTSQSMAALTTISLHSRGSSMTDVENIEVDGLDVSDTKLVDEVKKTLTCSLSTKIEDVENEDLKVIENNYASCV